MLKINYKIGMILIIIVVTLGLISCSNDMDDSQHYPIRIDKETLYTINNGHRNGEGVFISLSDEQLAYVYTCFTSGSKDSSSSDICYIVSDNFNRKKWTEPKVLIKNHGMQNIMSVSAVKLKDNSILIQYLEKNDCNNLQIVQRFSFDSLETFTDIKYITFDGYNVVNNDRLLYFNNEIFTPISQHSCIDNKFNSKGIMKLAITNHQGNTDIIEIDTNNTTTIFQEPGIVNLDDNSKMMMWFRNSTSSIYTAISNNTGRFFTEPTEGILKIVPFSPSSIKSINKHLFIVYNKYTDLHENNISYEKYRSPLVLAISKDGLNSIDQEYILENNTSLGYMYTSIYKDKDNILLAYMIQNKYNKFILKITKIKGLLQK